MRKTSSPGTTSEISCFSASSKPAKFVLPIAILCCKLCLANSSCWKWRFPTSGYATVVLQALFLQSPCCKSCVLAKVALHMLRLQMLCWKLCLRQCVHAHPIIADVVLQSLILQFAICLQIMLASSACESPRQLCLQLCLHK